MPTYEYLCDGCGHQFEKFQSIKTNPLRKCPECGKSRLKRLLGTGGGIIFKGSGFYQTDYRSESYKKAQSSTENKPKTDTAASDKKDTKPAKTETSTPPKDSPNKKD
jgi:putative FmdB family regulatory protein